MVSPVGNAVANNMQGTETVLAVQPIKIATVGDSITAGSGTSSGESYPDQLQRLLGSEFQVNNYGISGSTLLKQGNKPYWNETQYSNSKNSFPDIVVIQLGTNDSKDSNWLSHKDEFLTDYKALIAEYQGLSSHPEIYVALPPKVFGSNSSNIKGEVLENEIIPLITQVAKETGTTLIDNYAATTNLEAYFPDKVHPNDIGAFALAYNVYRHLKPSDDQVAAVFYEGESYTGQSFSLNGGAYTRDMLQAIGMFDSGISSLKVNKSSLIETYANSDLTGEKATFHTDTPSLANQISSLRIIVPAEPIRYEAEKLTAATSHGRNMVSVDDHAASGGKWHRADLSGVGEYIEYKLSIPAAGNYNVTFRTKNHPGRPIFQTYINDTPYGSVHNGYQPEPGGYQEVDLGNITFDTAGEQTIRFQITGKDPESTNWYISIDYIQLIPSSLTINQVEIEGDGYIGSELKAKVSFNSGLHDANESDFTYKWYRNGVEIPGADSQTYRVSEEDEGKVLYVSVTAKDVFGTEGNTLRSAAIEIGEIMSTNSWLLENDVLKAKIEFTSAGAIKMTSFYNKAAEKEYLPQGAAPNQSTLFHYNYRFLKEGATGQEPAITTASLNANDPVFTLGEVVHQNIEMKTSNGTVQQIGERWEIPVTKNELTITLSFEVYDGKAGIKYQAYIKNNSPDKRLQITSADVIKLDFPDESRNLHYSCITKWYSTTAGVDASNCGKSSEDIKVVINRYDTGDGFYISPEVNGKTQTYRRGSDTSKPYMGKSFAGIDAFTGDQVKVAVNEEVFKLVLFPQEEFEYIAVNMTAFKGDIVDGKMAAEEHLRKRFRYNDTSTILMTNDWSWGPPDSPLPDLRTEQYYRETVIPKAKEAGFDMIMWDDLWNTEEYNTPGTFRDSIIAIPRLTNNMANLTSFYRDNGFIFGAWYSMSGGYHNSGNDLADPAVIAAKKGMIETLINDYQLKHQMVDLTEYWLNDNVTDYSHPTDNVYRKNVLTRDVLNELVDKYPDYKVKLTTEVDIYPSQGDRSNELLHVINNGWTTSSTELGETIDIQNYTNLFGHLPLNSAYFNNGDMKNGRMATFYKYMFARNVKHGSLPHEWSQTSIDLVSAFNEWRKSARIQDLTNTIIRPVYNGQGWDSNVAANWDQSTGPYAMMYVSEQQDQALLIATDAGKGDAAALEVDLRWLDKTKKYLIQDISLDDTGEFTYRYKGLLTGSQLSSFNIDFTENVANARAFWITEYIDQDYQVLYADHRVDGYELRVNADHSMVVEASGKPGATGKVMVHSKAENKVMIVELQFDDTGSAVVEIAEFTETPEPFVVTPPAKLTVLAATLHHSGKTTAVGGNSRLADGGGTTGTSPTGETVKASENVLIFENIVDTDSYIEFKVSVPQAGVYNVQAVSKFTTSRGVGQWYVDGEKAGEPWNQLHTKDEMKFFDFGDMTFATPGEKVFRLQYQSGIKMLNVDRFEFTPKVKLDENIPASIEVTGETTLELGDTSMLQAQVNNLHPVYVDGDQIRWMIEEQNPVSGTGNVISLRTDGLKSEIIAKNPGTARVKVASLVSTEAVTYVDITVNAPASAIVSLTPVTVVTYIGTAPVLPAVITTTYGDGSKAELAVSWNTIDPVQYQEAGQFVVYGAVEGTSLEAVANITVKANTSGQPGGVYPGYNSDDDDDNVLEETPKPESEHVLAVEVTSEEWNKAIKDARSGKISLQIPQQQTITDYHINLPVEWVLEAAKSDQLTTIELLVGGVAVTVELKDIVASQYNNDQLQWQIVQKKATGKLAAQAEGPVYQIDILADGQSLSKGLPARLALGVELRAGQTPEKMIVYLITPNGDMRPVVSALYNSEEQGMIFAGSLDHAYVVVYRDDIRFADIANVPWAISSIEALAARNIIEGVGPYTFAPSKNVTRAEFITMLMRIFGWDSNAASDSNFADVPDNAWYSGAISAAFERGIIKGKGNGLFGPNENISREDMMVMLYHTLNVAGIELQAVNGNTSSFIDSAEVKDYAVEAVLKMQQASIVNGNGAGFFLPQSHASRAEAAVVLYRMLPFMN